MKVELIILLFFIIMLTGLIHSLVYSNLLVNVVVGAAYFLGFYGLLNIYESVRYKTQKKRLTILFAGVICVLIAYFCLEFALTQRVRINGRL